MGIAINREIDEASLISAVLAWEKFCQASEDIKPIMKANMIAGIAKNGGTKGLVMR